MATSHKRVVELTDSNGKVYILQFGTWAISKLEEQFDQGINAILETLTDKDKLRVGTLVSMVKVSIRGAKMEDEDVCDLIDDVGMEEIGRIFADMFGEKKKEEHAIDATIPQSAGELTGASVS